VAQPNEPEGTEELGVEGDNELIQDMRSKLAEAKSELKDLRQFKTEAEEKAVAARSKAAEAIVNALGFPGLKEDVQGWVEDDLTEESVREALQARGLLGEHVPEEPQDPGVENVIVEPVTPTTSQLGQQVANAAQGGGVKDVDARLAAADSVAELDAIMSELGATRDYSSG
jgi:hypothetical protein